MNHSAAFASSVSGHSRPLYVDPIISRENVQWAARRFILVYGEEAPDMALRQVTRLDRLGKIRTAEMFERVRQECARLLKKSEKLRAYPVN